MKKEDFTLFMKQVGEELRLRGNQGTAHIYRSTLNAVLAFQGTGKLSFSELTPEWLKRFETSLRSRGCSWNTVSTYLRTLRAVYNRAVTETYLKPFRSKKNDEANGQVIDFVKQFAGGVWY